MPCARTALRRAYRHCRQHRQRRSRPQPGTLHSLTPPPLSPFPSPNAGRRFSVKATPMMPLSAVVADVLGQLKLTEAGVRPQDCRLLLKGKPLTDLSTPVRFANIGRDKLELHTGGVGVGGGRH
jgi:hypothetical protein